MHMAKKVKHQISSLWDLEDYLKGYQVVSLSIGPKWDYYVLAVSNPSHKKDELFLKGNKEQNYRVISICYGFISVIDLHNQKNHYHFIQPIENEYILLASARSRYYSENDFDLNGKVFDQNGNLIREFLLGDGIQHLGVTSDNIIWTGYFDEGVFGNFGWKTPVGACGLRAWDKHGNTVYKYPNVEDHFICDCYALNVVSDHEIWFYYYTDFLLGRIKNGVIDYFDPKISYTDTFLVYNGCFLFKSGDKNQDQYYLMEFRKGKSLEIHKEITFINEENEVIHADNIAYRGHQLLIRSDDKLYLVDLSTLNIWND